MPLIVLCFAAAGCGWLPGGASTPWPPAYDAAPITLTVVDAATHEPVAGVVAVAHWELQYPYEGYIPHLGQVMILETVSDSQGRAHFPAWGPKPRGSSRGVLLWQSPEILLFLPQYVPRSLANEVRVKPDRSSHRTSEWDQKVVPLKRATSRDEYAAGLESLDQLFNSFPYLNEWVVGEASACEWHEVPLLLTSVEHERARLAAEGVSAQSLPRSLADRTRQQSKADIAKCGRITDRLKESPRRD